MFSCTPFYYHDPLEPWAVDFVHCLNFIYHYNFWCSIYVSFTTYRYGEICCLLLSKSHQYADRVTYNHTIGSCCSSKIHSFFVISGFGWERLCLSRKKFFCHWEGEDILWCLPECQCYRRHGYKTTTWGNSAFEVFKETTNVRSQKVHGCQTFSPDRYLVEETKLPAVSLCHFSTGDLVGHTRLVTQRTWFDLR